MDFAAAAVPLSDGKCAATRGDRMAIQFAERLCAFFLLLMLAPFLALAAVITAVLSGDSPFVAHRRAGLDGELIWILKLRTMWGPRQRPRVRRLVHYLGQEFVPAHKTGRDSRVTSRFAAFCRRYSIDELPQLWQVVHGDLALVGPRPLTTNELHVWYRDCAAEVLSVRPGITGLWQVTGRNSLTYRQRRALDLFLVRRWSARLYVAIVAATIPAVISGRHAC